MAWDETRDGTVALARFSSPPMNYFTDDDVEELEGLIDTWSDPGVRAVVLAGGVPGRFITHFNADQIMLKQTEPEGPIDTPRRGRRVHALGRRLNELPGPVICALNGDAMGWGFELALATDIRIGERGDYRYGLPEVRLGIVPGGGGLTRMVKLVGVGRALELGMGARVLTPEEALGYGLLEELADDAVAAAMEMAGRIAALPRTAVAMAKKIVYQGAGQPLDVGLAFELEAAYRAKQSPEAAEALAAYLAVPLEQRRDWLDPRG
jgi:enoyl-CoA hydratase